MTQNQTYTIVTAGSSYLDIDAYACSIAMAELLRLKGINAIAYSAAPYNYSVCPSLVRQAPIADTLPLDCREQDAAYIIVDVSDPDYIRDAVPLERVCAVYDHHVGFEEYWMTRIGERTHIEFIGAAATLIVREWKQSGLLERMKSATRRLLIAAILDNTLNLTSSNTTPEDVEAFRLLCAAEAIGEEWCAAYYSEVQASVEADLKNALFHDIKTIRNNAVLPPRVAQLCVWDAQGVFEHLSDIRRWFEDSPECWMINVIDLHERCSYFVCDDPEHQKALETVFDVRFEAGIARSPVSYLRKELIKKTC